MRKKPSYQTAGNWLKNTPPSVIQARASAQAEKSKKVKRLLAPLRNNPVLSEQDAETVERLAGQSDIGVSFPPQWIEELERVYDRCHDGLDPTIDRGED